MASLVEKLFNISAAGLSLFYLQPLINESRLSTLATNPEGLVINFILIMLIPLVWVAYIFLSMLEIKRAIGKPNIQNE